MELNFKGWQQESTEKENCSYTGVMCAPLLMSPRGLARQTNGSVWGKSWHNYIDYNNNDMPIQCWFTCQWGSSNHAKYALPSATSKSWPHRTHEAKNPVPLHVTHVCTCRISCCAVFVTSFVDFTVSEIDSYAQFMIHDLREDSPGGIAQLLGDPTKHQEWAQEVCQPPGSAASTACRSRAKLHHMCLGLGPHLRQVATEHEVTNTHTQCCIHTSNSCIDS